MSLVVGGLCWPALSSTTPDQRLRVVSMHLAPSERTPYRRWSGTGGYPPAPPGGFVKPPSGLGEVRLILNLRSKISILIFQTYFLFLNVITVMRHIQSRLEDHGDFFKYSAQLHKDRHRVPADIISYVTRSTTCVCMWNLCFSTSVAFGSSHTGAAVMAAQRNIGGHDKTEQLVHILGKHLSTPTIIQDYGPALDIKQLKKFKLMFFELQQIQANFSFVPSAVKAALTAVAESKSSEWKLTKSEAMQFSTTVGKRLRSMCRHVGQNMIKKKQPKWLQKLFAVRSYKSIQNYIGPHLQLVFRLWVPAPRHPRPNSTIIICCLESAVGKQT